ncbi:Golgi phosphoprotein 3 GPP34 [Paractinoplanes brasiliensis]|uniref:Golgi phosphoprotein 3 GPP34 n=1 Tax=Paractinoplanes brasiliensis TaxID=52695 RepID=A0A4R6JRG8_9ACTN|nr:Golgi phosphoprotein 3 GPP34 [Actinoplanes brasiliensis]
MRERLWLLAHDDRADLQPLLNPGALAIGLMAATLVDLLLDDRIVCRGGFLKPHLQSGRRAASRELDPITAGVLHELTGETSRLSDVLRAARAELPADQHHPYVRLYQRTLAALLAAGVVTEQRRTLRATRFYLADAGGLSWNRGQLNTRLVYHDRPSDPVTDCLAALVWCLNLHTMLATPYTPGEAATILRQITEAIPRNAGPSSPLTVVPHLAACVRTAVGDLATAAF